MRDDSVMIDWDPEIDTPATIAIIGAGPVGIEAALYARFLGYYVLLFDAGKVADSVIKWGHVPMFTPFGANCSALGLAALEAHDNLAGLPGPDEYVTGREYAERYLIPVARTDLVYDSVHVHSRVHSISRILSRRGQRIARQDRADEEFRIVIESKKRGWYSERADIVLDCSGTYRSARWLGPGGGMSIGELDLDEHIERGVPDVLGAAREKYASKHTVLVGSGFMAALTAVKFAELIRADASTRLTWVVSHPTGDASASPQLSEHCAPSSRFVQRTELAAAARRLLDGSSDGLAVVGAWGIERIERLEAEAWRVRLLTGEEETLDLRCDQVISAVGYQPDWEFASPLQIQRSLSNDAPLATAARLLIDEPTSDLSSLEFSAQDVLSSEPHYYVLGSKSFGTDSRFLIQHGFHQIRQVFSLIGNRADLNLYGSVRPRQTG